ARAVIVTLCEPRIGPLMIAAGTAIEVSEHRGCLASVGQSRSDGLPDHCKHSLDRIDARGSDVHAVEFEIVLVDRLADRGAHLDGHVSVSERRNLHRIELNGGHRGRRSAVRDRIDMHLYTPSCRTDTLIEQMPVNRTEGLPKLYTRAGSPQSVV